MLVSFLYFWFWAYYLTCLLFLPHYLAYLFIYPHSGIQFCIFFLFFFAAAGCEALVLFFCFHFASAVVVYASCSFSCLGRDGGEYLCEWRCSCVRAANVNELVQCQSRNRSSVRSIGHEKAVEGEAEKEESITLSLFCIAFWFWFFIAFNQERNNQYMCWIKQ